MLRQNMILALALSLALAATARAEPVIIAANGVLADFAARLSGGAAQVVMPVPLGTDPAAWQPGIAEIGAMQAADILLLSGSGMEPWVGRASLPRATRTEATQALADRIIRRGGLTHSHGGEGSHSHSAPAPEIWLDFALAAGLADAVAAPVGKALPDKDVAGALAALRAELLALDATARTVGAALAGQTVLTFQPGYEYFGRAYGVTLADAALDARQDASPAELARLDAILAATGARLILSDAAPPLGTAAALTDRGVTVVVFPLATTLPPGNDAVTVFRTALDSLAAATAP